jgi:hypothetical protein
MDKERIAETEARAEMLERAQEVAIQVEFACKHNEGQFPAYIRVPLERWVEARNRKRQAAQEQPE